MTKYFAVIGNRDHIKHEGQRKPFWDFLDVVPDGYLSSLAYLPLRDFELPTDKPKFGDCGAWSYKHEKTPKLGKNLVTPQWVVAEYQKYFQPGDLVVAPDHMLIPFDGVDLDERRSFNVQSAREFLPIARDAGFNPVATVHGMDLEERLINVGRLYEMGYKHFALGGLAARAGQKRECISSVAQIVSKVRSLLPDAWVHVLGLSSPDYLEAWESIGVSSFDGSSHFKQAFTAGAFYTLENGKLVKHQAIRPGEQMRDDMPVCECRACVMLRQEGIDTRSYGSNENNMGRAAHNLNMLMRAHEWVRIKEERSPLVQAILNSFAPAVLPSSAASITLVSCVGAKQAEASPARDLYRSAWFIKARDYCDRQGCDWYVISAKHGLIHRDSVIEPYEQTLNTMPKSERQAWAAMTFQQILKALPDGGTIRIMAGDRYRADLVPLLKNAGYLVEIPLKGLGIGQQLAWFDRQTTPQQLKLFDNENP